MCVCLRDENQHRKQSKLLLHSNVFILISIPSLWLVHFFMRESFTALLSHNTLEKRFWDWLNKTQSILFSQIYCISLKVIPSHHHTVIPILFPVFESFVILSFQYSLHSGQRILFYSFCWLKTMFTKW